MLGHFQTKRTVSESVGAGVARKTCDLLPPGGMRTHVGAYFIALVAEIWLVWHGAFRFKLQRSATVLDPHFKQNFCYVN